jgi:hypothetical protein
MLSSRLCFFGSGKTPLSVIFSDSKERAGDSSTSTISVHLQESCYRPDHLYLRDESFSTVQPISKGRWELHGIISGTDTWECVGVLENGTFLPAITKLPKRGFLKGLIARNVQVNFALIFYPNEERGASMAILVNRQLLMP